MLRRIKLHGAAKASSSSATPTSATTVEAQLLLQGFRRRRALHRRDQAARSADRRPRAQRRSFRDGFPDREHQGAARRRHQNGNFIHARGKDVDRHRRRRHRHRLRRHCRCATAARASCSSRSCRKPPMDRAADNPWPEWPKVYKLDYGQEEAAAKFGADPRVYLTTAKKFDGDDSGQVKEVVTVADRVGEERQGPVRARRKFPAPRRCCPRSSSCWRWASSGPSSRCSKRLGVERDARSNVKAEHDKYHDQPQRRLCRRRLPPRPEPGRLGLQRRPRRRARVRPLPDGQHRPSGCSASTSHQSHPGPHGDARPRASGCPCRRVLQSGAGELSRLGVAVWNGVRGREPSRMPRVAARDDRGVG